MSSFLTYFVQCSEVVSNFFFISPVALMVVDSEWIRLLHRSMTRVPGLHSSLHGEKVSCSWSRVFTILVSGDFSRFVWAGLRFASAKVLQGHELTLNRINSS